MAKDPESIHRSLTSGDAGRIHEAAALMYSSARSVDEARDKIAHGVGTPSWTGLAAISYQTRGKALFVAAAGSSWGLYRTGDFLLAAETAYRQTVRSADSTIRFWRKLGQAQRTGALELLVTQQLVLTQVGWEAWLGQAAAGLDDDGGTAFEHWLEQGAGNNYDYMARTGAKRGFRIPDSILNGDDRRWTQQGLAYSPGSEPGTGTYFLTSYRDEDGRTEDGTNDPDESQLTLVDEKTGMPSHQVQLVGKGGSGAPSHSGGVAVQGGDVYVVGGGTIYRYDLEELRNARPGQQVPARSETPIDAHGTSYVTISGGRVLIGDHYGEKLYAYDLDDVRTGNAGDYQEFAAPEGANGVIVNPDGGFTFTENNGRDGGSNFLTYPPYQPGDSLPDGTEFGYGNLIEEAVVVDGQVTALTESGADPYAPWDRDDDSDDDSGSQGKGDDLWGQTHTFLLPADGVRSGDGFAVRTVTLEEARKAFITASDSLDGAAAEIDRTQLTSWVLGEVPAADTFSSAVNRYLGDCAAHLREGVSGTEDTSTGLWKTSEAFEGSDGSSASVFGQYVDWLTSTPSGPPS